jgi:hypothetical protein
VKRTEHGIESIMSVFGTHPFAVAAFAQSLPGTREPLLHASGRNDERLSDLNGG